MIPNPWVILGFLVALAGVYGYGHHEGYAERDQEMQAQIAKLNEESRVKEQQMTNQVNAKAAELRKAKDEITKKQSDIDKRIDSGQLQFPTSCVQSTQDARSATGNSTNSTESDRQAIKDIVSITTDGDKAIEQLNTCIAAYNMVKEKINGKR
jgi:hypothetical protein